MKKTMLANKWVFILLPLVGAVAYFSVQGIGLADNGLPWSALAILCVFTFPLSILFGVAILVGLFPWWE